MFSETGTRFGLRVKLMISFCDIFFLSLRRFAFIWLSCDLVEYT